MQFDHGIVRPFDDTDTYPMEVRTSGPGMELQDNGSSGCI